MPMILWLLAFARVAVAGPLNADLDGDGKADNVVHQADGWYINATRLELESEHDMYVFEPLDIVAGDKVRELSVCELGPRDDRMCRAYRWTGGKLIPIPVTDDRTFSSLQSTGNGIVLAKAYDRLGDRVHKLVFEGGSLRYIEQPFFYLGKELHVEVSVPIVLAPADDAAVVANLKPDSSIVVLLAHPTLWNWYLVKTSTGLVGWIEANKLAEASEEARGAIWAG